MEHVGVRQHEVRVRPDQRPFRPRRVAVVDGRLELRELQRADRAELVARERLRREEEQRGGLRAASSAAWANASLYTSVFPLAVPVASIDVAAVGERLERLAPGAGTGPRSPSSPSRPTSSSGRSAGNGTHERRARGKVLHVDERPGRSRDRRSGGRGTPAGPPALAGYGRGDVTLRAPSRRSGVRNPSREQRERHRARCPGRGSRRRRRGRRADADSDLRRAGPRARGRRGDELRPEQPEQQPGLARRTSTGSTSIATANNDCAAVRNSSSRWRLVDRQPVQARGGDREHDRQRADQQRPLVHLRAHERAEPAFVFSRHA